MAVNSSMMSYSGIVKNSTSPLPEAGRTGRMIPATSNRRTGRSSEEWWVMDAMIVIRKLRY
jgi:hypothetical protein